MLIRISSRSYNKIVQYGAGIFLAQMRELDNALDSHDLLIMSGYGWGDKGINMRLKNWLWGKSGRQIHIPVKVDTATGRIWALHMGGDPTWVEIK